MMRLAAFRCLTRCTAAVLMTAVLSSCSPWWKKEPEPIQPAPVKPEPVKPTPPVPVKPPEVKKTVPETPAGSPEQYFFPHGHLGQLAVYDDYVVHAPSWTRGDGIAFFDVSDPNHPFYAYGLPSAGYTSDVARRGNVLYFATNYSILTVRMPFRHKIRLRQDVPPRILENTLIQFPNGGCCRLAIYENHLYVTAPDGLREYSFADDGRPEYCRTIRELSGVTEFAITNRRIYYLLKNSKQNVYCRTLSRPDRMDFVRISKFPVDRIFAGGNKQVFLFGNRKLCRLSDMGEVFPGAAVTDVSRITGDTFSVRYDVGGKTVRELTDGVSLHRIMEQIPARGSRVVAETEKGNFVAWVDGNDVCFSRQKPVPFGKPVLGKLPVTIRNEAPVTVCGEYVYSIDRNGGTYTLYGYRADRPQTPDRAFDVCVSWPVTSKKNFNYDIVIPPFSFYHFGKYLFAPEAILDVSDPASPKVVQKLDGAACSIVRSSDDLIYLAQGHKLTVLDGKALPSLKIVAELPADEKVKQWTDIETDGKHLYLNARDKLMIFNMLNPKNPHLVSELPLPGRSYKIFRYGKMLYLPPYGGDRTPFRIVDASRPEAPVVAGTIPDLEGHAILGAIVRGDSLYIADGIRILRFSLKNPARPREERSWNGPDQAMQGYSFIDVRNGILVGKKYPRFDVWRISE